MSGAGTGRRTDETKSAGVKLTGALTESQARAALKCSRRRLLIMIRTGRLFSFWVKGRRYVTLPLF